MITVEKQKLGSLQITAPLGSMFILYNMAEGGGGENDGKMIWTGIIPPKSALMIYTKGKISAIVYTNGRVREVTP